MIKESAGEKKAYNLSCMKKRGRGEDNVIRYYVIVVWEKILMLFMKMRLKNFSEKYSKNVM